MDKTFVAEIVDRYLADSDKYRVDVRLESDDRVVVEIDGDTPVSIDLCAALSKHIEAQFNRDEEDFELEVGSYGISQPFKVLRQYRNAVGKEVSVALKTGMKLQGVLKTVDEKELVVTITKQVKPEGAKRKVWVEEDLTLDLAAVKEVKYIIKL